MDNSLQQVMALVMKYLPDGAAVAADPDADLRQAGLDSMGIVTLLADIERDFGVDFPAEYITPATFASVRNLHMAVLKCRCGQPASRPAAERAGQQREVPMVRTGTQE